MKLYVIYIGGSHPKSLIELHDMRFVIADKIEDTYPVLKRSWWGMPESLHLDAWGALSYADGYDIVLKNTPPQDKSRQLYFMNLGGYDHEKFTELHENIFIVAENEKTAKLKAVEKFSHWVTPHRDYQYNIENIINISQLISNQAFHLHLEPTDQPKKFEFICEYTPIGKGEAIA